MCKGHLGEHMRYRVAAIALTWLVFSMGFAPTATAARFDAGSLSESELSVSGGGSVLTEVHTATWCPSCAELDDVMKVLRTEHGERMTMISLHPDDGSDTLGNQASEHRLARLHSIEGRATGTPTIFMEGTLAREGAVSGSQVSLALFDAESDMRSRTALQLTAKMDGDLLVLQVEAEIDDDQTFANTQVSILLGDDDPDTTDSEIATGGGPFDAALTSLLEVSLDEEAQVVEIDAFPAGMWTISEGERSRTKVSFQTFIQIGFEAAGDTTIVIAHEADENHLSQNEAFTYGSISIVQENVNSDELLNWVWLVGGLLIIGIVIIAVPERKSGVSSHTEKPPSSEEE